MKKWLPALFLSLLVLWVFTAPALLAANDSKKDLTALERDVSKILKNQEDILKRLDEMKEALRVLKIRVS